MEPLVETLERLTVGWVRVAEVDAVDPVLPEEGGVPLTRSAAGGCRESETSDMRIDDSEDGQSTPPIPSCPGDGRGMNLAGTRQSSALRRVSGRAQPRAVFAYQWRSERTGKALLRELGRAFHVREIGAEVRLVLRVSEMDLIGPVSLPAPWNTTVAVIEPERTLFSGRLVIFSICLRWGWWWCMCYSVVALSASTGDLFQEKKTSHLLAQYPTVAWAVSEQLRRFSVFGTARA